MPFFFATFLLILASFLVPAQAEAERLDLAWFEQRAGRALTVLAAQDAVDADQAQARQARSSSGWKLLGRAAAGHVDEPVDDERSRNYEFLALRLGLRYPLLGSRAQELDRVRDAESRALAAAAEKSLLEREILSEVRQAYLAYWSASEKSRITRTFLGSEASAGRLLDLGRARGQLLEADRLQALTRYGAARRDLARLQMEADLALARLNRLTDSQLKDFEPVAPVIGGFCDDVLHLAARLQEHPALQLEQVLLARQREREDTGASDQIDSGVGLYQNLGREFPGGSVSSTVAAVDFEMPLGAFAAGEAARARQQALARQAERNLAGQRQKLLEEAESLHFAARYQTHNLDFVRQRVEAAEERVRERFLRTALLEESDHADLQEAVFAYYRASLDLLEAEHNCLQLKADLARLVATDGSEACPHCLAPPRLAGRGPNFAILGRELYDELERAVDQAALRAGSRRLFAAGGDAALTAEEMAAGASVPVRVVAPAPAPPAAPPSARRIVAEEISEPPQPRPRPAPVVNMERQRGLGALMHRAEALPPWQGQPADDWANRFGSHQPFDSLLIRLDADQVQRLSKDRPLRQRFASLLTSLAVRGIRPDLVLAQPDWLLTAGGARLFAAIETLGDLPFGGLHLALDPVLENTGSDSAAKRLDQLRNTLVGAIAKSPWPVSASLRPRHLEARVLGQSFAARLESLQLEYLALTVNGGEVEAAVALAEPLLAIYPQLPLRVLADVRATGATGGRTDFMGSLAQLRRRLSAYPNFTGLLVQPYQDFQEMPR